MRKSNGTCVSERRLSGAKCRGSALGRRRLGLCEAVGPCSERAVAEQRVDHLRQAVASEAGRDSERLLRHAKVLGELRREAQGDLPLLALPVHGGCLQASQ